MQTPFSAVTRWWRNRIAAHANAASLNSCSAEDTGRMAHDVGVTATELRSLAGKWPDSADLLNRRLGVLGLDPEDLRRAEPQVVPDLQRVCTMCVNTRECRHDLDRNPSDPEWRKYCPNVMTLDALTAERAKKTNWTLRVRLTPADSVPPTRKRHRA